MRTLHVWFAVGFALWLGCTRKVPEPALTTAGSAATGAVPRKADNPPATGAATTASDLAWEAPSGWKSKDNASPMRIASYVVPRVTGDPEDGDLSISKAGGTVDMNVERWQGQFTGGSGAKRTPLVADGVNVTLVEVKGAYTGSMGPANGSNPKGQPAYALLAAIAETSPALTFFKLVGPQKTVESAREDFERMIRSLRRK